MKTRKVKQVLKVNKLKIKPNQYIKKRLVNSHKNQN